METQAVETQAPAADIALEDRIEAILFKEPKPGSEKTTEKQSAAEKPAEEPKPELDAEGKPVVKEEAKAEEKPAEETYEFEWKGTKYQVPPELKDLHEGYLRNEDYTKKTQETAEMRRSAEALLQQAQKFQELQQAAQPQFETLAAVNQRLKAFQQINWNDLTAKDPVEAQRMFMAYQQTKEAKATAEADLQKAIGQHEQVANETRQKILQEGAKILERDIKGWSPEKAAKLNDFARATYGFTAQEVASVADARVVKMINDAQQWHALQQSKPQLENKVVQASKTLKPQASDPASQKSQAEAEIKRGIRSEKTDSGKAKHIQRLLESRF